MNLAAFLPRYFSWHYKNAYSHIYGIWLNMIRFALEFFSVGLLLKTLFSPFERLNEEYKSGLEAKAETAFVNLMMRIVGLLVRLPVVILGLVSAAFVFFAGLVFFLLWTVLPVVFVFFLMFGIIGIFR